MCPPSRETPLPVYKSARRSLADRVARFFRRRVPTKRDWLHGSRYGLAVVVASLLVFVKSLRDTFEHGAGGAAITAAFVWPVGKVNHAGGAFHSSMRRLEGTVLASIVSYVILLVGGNRSDTAKVAALAVWSMLCVLVTSNAGKYRYAAEVALFTAPIIMLGSGDSKENSLSRMEQNLFGVLVVMTIQLTVPPISLASSTLLRSLQSVLGETGEKLMTLTHVFLGNDSLALGNDGVDSDRSTDRLTDRTVDGTDSADALPAHISIVRSQQGGPGSGVSARQVAEIAMTVLPVPRPSRSEAVKLCLRRTLAETRALRLQVLQLQALVGAASDEPVLLRKLRGISGDSLLARTRAPTDARLTRALFSVMHATNATLQMSAQTVTSRHTAESLVTDTVALFEARNVFLRCVENFTAQRTEMIRRLRQLQVRHQMYLTTPSFCAADRFDSPSMAPVVSTKALTKRLAIPHNEAVLAQHAFFFAVKHVAMYPP
ncbi:MAG: hypothetical protein MHM6MM_009024, partial [Cercozoa sp. M6MM]